MKKKLKAPKFKNEEQERAFWADANLSDYFESADFTPYSRIYFEASQGTGERTQCTVSIIA